MASGERFSGFSASGQSTGLPQKTQETCHSARRPIRRRAWLACELAEEVRPGTSGLQAGASEDRAFHHALPARPSWRVAQFDTLRLRLLKIAARVVEWTTKVMIHVPSACPDMAILRLVVDRLPRLVI